MKKIISIILTICLLLTLCPFGITASAKTIDYGSFVYEVNNFKGTLTKCRMYNVQEMVGIPGGDYWTLVAIGDYAFTSCDIRSIKIPRTITMLHPLAFIQGFDYLSTITVGEGNTVFHSVDNSLIETETKKLVLGSKSGIIPSDGSVTSIRSYAYSNRKNLESVTIPEAITFIGDSVFIGCSALTSIVVDENNEYYSSEDGVLFNKDKTVLIRYPSNKTATSYTVPESVTSIADYAFEGCSNLTSINIPNSVTEIGDGAFEYCTAIKSIDIPDKVTTIECNTFKNCTALKSIDIPDSVTVINDYAFADCESLEDICIPDSVTKIGSGAFAFTAWILNQPEGVVYAGKVAYVYKGTCPETVTVKDGTVSISSDAFSDCTNLKNIYLPDSIQFIGVRAFDGCSGLTEITIPESTTEIEQFAFRNCSSIERLNFNATNCSERSQNAFIGCTQLTELNIGENVTNIPEFAFDSFSNITSVTIPDKVTTIGNQSFQGCTSLTEITIPENVATIGIYAFGDCQSLSKVNFNAINCIDMYSVFEGCTQITELKIGENVTNIPSYAFRGFSNITSVTIPSKVTAIGRSAFWDWTNLSKVVYLGNCIQRRLNLSIDSDYNTELLNAEWQYNSLSSEDHFFDNACDSACDVCDFTRTVGDHIYDNLCDTNCNECGLKRTVEGHKYDNACDNECEYCGNIRNVQDHIYENSEDLICNECGYERPSYIIGDVDGEDGITDWDGVMLARYLAGWTVEITAIEALDIDGDGEITDWDGVLLDRYLAGWNVEIG